MRARRSSSQPRQRDARANAGDSRDPDGGGGGGGVCVDRAARVGSASTAALS
jgi:hypothetical protein